MLYVLQRRVMKNSDSFWKLTRFEMSKRLNRGWHCLDVNWKLWNTYVLFRLCHRSITLLSVNNMHYIWWKLRGNSKLISARDIEKLYFNNTWNKKSYSDEYVWNVVILNPESIARHISNISELNALRGNPYTATAHVKFSFAGTN